MPWSAGTEPVSVDALRRVLLATPVDGPRAAVDAAAALVRQVSSPDDIQVLAELGVTAALSLPGCPEAVLARTVSRLSERPSDVPVAVAVARNPNCPPDLLCALGVWDDPAVSEAVYAHPLCPEQTRAFISLRT